MTMPNEGSKNLRARKITQLKFSTGWVLFVRSRPRAIAKQGPFDLDVR